MILFLGGAENPTWRQQLVEAGATSVSLSFSTLRGRLPKHKPYLLEERFPESMRVALEPGNIAKRDLTDDEVDGWAEAYHDLVEANQERLNLVVEIDAYADYSRIEENRELFWQHVPYFLPMWKPDLGHEELERLLRHWNGVALTASALEGDHRVRALLTSYGRRGAVVHATGLARPEDLHRLPISTASTIAWTAPARYGDTVFWDGKRLRRHPAAYKDDARKRYRTRIADAGFDPDAIAADDETELTRMAIWSFQRLEESLARSARETIATTDDLNPPPSTPQDPPVPVGIDRPGVLNYTARATRSLLPLIGVDTEEVHKLDDDGEQSSTEEQFYDHAGGENLLSCDSCHVAASCPEAQPGARCAYEIPVSLKSQKDLSRFLTAMLEIQGQRVLFARFAEELEGGYPDPTTSKEMERLFSMVERMKEIQDNREFVKMSVEARGQAGVISRLFGSQVAEAQQALPAPVDANLLGAEIIDAEAV